MYLWAMQSVPAGNFSPPYRLDNKYYRAAIHITPNNSKAPRPLQGSRRQIPFRIARNHPMARGCARVWATVVHIVTCPVGGTWTQDVLYTYSPP